MTAAEPGRTGRVVVGPATPFTSWSWPGVTLLLVVALPTLLAVEVHRPDGSGGR